MWVTRVQEKWMKPGLPRQEKWLATPVFLFVEVTDIVLRPVARAARFLKTVYAKIFPDDALGLYTEMMFILGFALMLSLLSGSW